MSQVLRISSSSWHYRLLAYTQRLFGEEPETPASLCVYFWSVVACPLAIFGAYVGRLIVFLLRPLGPVGRWILNREPIWIACGASAALASGLTTWALLDWTLFWQFFAILSVGIATVSAVGFALVLLVERYQRRKDLSEDQGPSTIGLAWMVAMAKKRRICPLIQVTP